MSGSLPNICLHLPCVSLPILIFNNNASLSLTWIHSRVFNTTRITSHKNIFVFNAKYKIQNVFNGYTHVYLTKMDTLACI